MGEGDVGPRPTPPLKRTPLQAVTKFEEPALSGVEEQKNMEDPVAVSTGPMTIPSKGSKEKKEKKTAWKTQECCKHTFPHYLTFHVPSITGKGTRVSGI